MAQVIQNYEAIERYAKNSNYRNGRFYFISWKLPTVSISNMKKYGIKTISIEKTGHCHYTIEWDLPSYLSKEKRKEIIDKNTLESRIAREKLMNAMNEIGFNVTRENSIEMFNALPPSTILEAYNRHELKQKLRVVK